MILIVIIIVVLFFLGDVRLCILNLTTAKTERSDVKHHISFVSENNDVVDSKVMCRGEVIPASGESPTMYCHFPSFI